MGEAPFFVTDLGTLHHADCLSWLAALEPESIDCVVTSPPFWGLRNYGAEGQLGQERTPQEYIENMRRVFALVQKALKHDGSLWLNLGDNFYGGPPKTQPKDARGLERETLVDLVCEKCGVSFRGRPTRRFCTSKCGGSLNRRRTGFERPKCLLGLPWRVATAMVEKDDWTLRNDVVWHKPNARPSPFEDRLSLTYEHLFHFTKPGRWINGRKWDAAYYYDLDAMKIPAKGRGMKNRGDVWSINTVQSREGHYAVFPPSLIEQPIRATCPIKGVVCDPFMGTGTVAIVAEALGRHWIGCEIGKKHCETIARRVRDVRASTVFSGQIGRAHV